MVDLKQSCLHSHLWLADALHKLHDLLDHCSRVFHKVDVLEHVSGCVSLLLNSLSDLGVGGVVLVVDVGQLDKRDSSLENFEIELIE